MGEDEGIDFVGLDFGVGDGARAERVADDDFPHEGREEVDDRPGVESGFDGERDDGREVLLAALGDISRFFAIEPAEEYEYISRKVIVCQAFTPPGAFHAAPPRLA